MSRHCGKRELAILGEKIQALESAQGELAKISNEIEKDPRGQSLRSTFVILGDEIEKTRTMMEDLILSPENGEDNGVVDDCTLNNVSILGTFLPTNFSLCAERLCLFASPCHCTYMAKSSW